MNPGPKDCLIVTDVQIDFCPGGALEVPDGHEVVAVINALGRTVPHRILTQDWHPADHASFASNRPGKSAFETITASYGEQVLWPDHCVQGTRGAEFHPDLDTRGAEMVIRKGFRRDVDSYSAFYENDRRTPTGLAGYLRTRGFERVLLTGLATDFCVGFSAVDAVREGFEVYVIEDACRAIDLDGSLERAKQNMSDVGVHFIQSTSI